MVVEHVIRKVVTPPWSRVFFSKLRRTACEEVSKLLTLEGEPMLSNVGVKALTMFALEELHKRARYLTCWAESLDQDRPVANIFVISRLL